MDIQRWRFGLACTIVVIAQPAPFVPAQQRLQESWPFALKPNLRSCKALASCNKQKLFKQDMHNAQALKALIRKEFVPLVCVARVISV